MERENSSLLGSSWLEVNQYKVKRAKERLCERERDRAWERVGEIETKVVMFRLC